MNKLAVCIKKEPTMWQYKDAKILIGS